ncbi:MAG: hypothetical protein KatS3mg032_0710 [Cyclobacteriaceae bacterium]|nr:MAG: hypothetical protein KatS3mg032_0710 [Cyclobacteriaceae bacterium]
MQPKLLISCFFACLCWGSLPGQTITPARNLPDNITSVTVFGPFRLTIIPAGENRVAFDYGTVHPDDVIAEAEKGILILKLRNRKYLDDLKEDRPAHYVKVRLYIKDLEEIKARAGAVVRNEPEMFLKSRNLLIESEMGADVRLQLLAKNLYVRCSMGSNTSLSGKTTLLEIKAGMGAILNARNLVSEVCKARASTGAELDVHARGSLDVDASMGAVVYYSGNPRLTDTTLLFGAEIVKHKSNSIN